MPDRPGSRLRWAVGVLRRRWVDGRFPPQTAEAVRMVVRFAVRDRAAARWASILRPYGGRNGPPGRAAEARRVPGEWRRWYVADDLDVPVAELPHVVADEVVSRLDVAATGVFLVDARADGALHVGVPLDRRAAALDALGNLDPADAWYVIARRGGRDRVALLHSRAGRRRARRAERWVLFRCRAVGSRMVGPEHGVEVSFWAAASGRMERIGVRGLERFEADASRTVEQVAGRSYPGLAAFPVERALTRLHDPIDVVITWVDGSDPAWRAEFDRWSATAVDPQVTHPARFASHDELRFVLRSLWLNAGWVRRVHLVTAGQVPDWLVEDERLRVVDHAEIFPAGWLPTFNSHAIEARLHHIDGLAEHVLYLNDDMFVARPLGPDRFFTANGLPRFFESDARVPLTSGNGDRSVDTAARQGQRLIEATFAMTVERKLHHAPYALRRSVLSEIADRYAEVVDATAQHRFRHPDDLSIPSAFAHHYGFCTGRAVPGELDVVYENLGGRRLALTLRRLRSDRSVEAFCINETERWETDRGRALDRLGPFLAARFPVASPWER